MSKKYARLILLAFVGVLALNLCAEVAWTTGSCAPSEWTALERNVLRNLKGMMVVNNPNTYGNSDLMVLADGEVPIEAGKDWIVGIQPNSEIDWIFSGPVNLEQLRISSAYLEDPNFSGINIKAVKVKELGSDEWVEIGYASGRFWGNNLKNIVVATLSDVEGGFLAQNVTALKVVFGDPVWGNANYYAEIEAIGEMGPMLDGISIEPLKTKARISGTAVAGTDATECDVYLAIGDSRRVRIAKSVSGSFQYVIKDLQPSTTYSYDLYVVNNAPLPKESVYSGIFTTMSANELTVLWSASDIVPQEWVDLSGDLLEGLEGKIEGAVTTGYSTRDPKLVTDGCVPQEGGNGYRVGFQSSSSIEWTFDNPKDIGLLRVSACYFEGPEYNKISIRSVEVRSGDSEEWVKLKADAFLDNTGRKENVVISVTLSDSEMECLAKGATGLKIVFGDGVPLASYVVEIEAVEYVYVPESKPGFAVIVR